MCFLFIFVHECFRKSARTPERKPLNAHSCVLVHDTRMYSAQSHLSARVFAFACGWVWFLYVCHFRVCISVFYSIVLLLFSTETSSDQSAASSFFGLLFRGCYLHMLLKTCGRIQQKLEQDPILYVGPSFHFSGSARKGANACRLFCLHSHICVRRPTCVTFSLNRC